MDLMEEGRYGLSHSFGKMDLLLCIFDLVLDNIIRIIYVNKIQQGSRQGHERAVME